jgi:hypothetical protein
MRPMWIYGITALAVVAFVVLCVWYFFNRPADTPVDTIFQNILLALAALGALLSAVYALWSSNLAWLAYQAANQPSALFRAVSVTENNTQKTLIVYRNNSTHDVRSMEVNVRVLSGQHEYDLSNLFPRPLNLPAGDERQRRFDTHVELSKRGLNLTGINQGSAPVRLLIGYSHEHGGRRIEIPVQQSYVWNVQDNQWNIG